MIQGQRAVPKTKARKISLSDILPGFYPSVYTRLPRVRFLLDQSGSANAVKPRNPRKPTLCDWIEVIVHERAFLCQYLLHKFLFFTFVTVKS